ncbi:recombinase family protein [Streptomyces agglomeratus]|uniref:recombinase family protein n=1 Tax=Streptomyces agglomeratus TaxID=285458 RepID=UPI0009A05FD6|nr:recombinase family protein [Streptomyces agglomeratus]
MNQLRFYLYARKSTQGEDRQALSIQAQVRRAQEIFPDLNIVKVIEERQSAFEPGKRPKFSQVLADIDDGKIDGIVAWHPDRLSRNEEDAAKITYRTRKGVIKDLRFCSYNFDNSPEGIMMLQLALSQSQYFSSKLGKDVKRGMEQKLRMGWLPRMAPIGYLNNVVDHTVIEDPDRFALVRRMWDRLLSGLYTPPRILQMASEEWGLTTVRRKRMGGAPLTRGGIYRVFRDPFYAGLIRWDGEIYPGNHNAMVTLEEFKRAQAILGGGRNRTGKLVKHDFPYRGLIACGECEAQYTAEVQKGHVYYHCTRRKKVRCYQTKNIREESVQAEIDGVLARYGIHAEFRAWALKYLAEVTHVDARDAEQIQSARASRAQQLRDQLSRLLDLKLQGLIDDEDFTHKQKDMKAEISELENQIALAADLQRRLDTQTRRALDLATYGRDVLSNGSSHKKRIIASKIATAYVALDGRLDIKVSDWLVPLEGVAASPQAISSGSPDGPRSLTQVRTREAQHFGSSKRKTAVSAAVCSSWQSIVDNVRSRIEVNLDDMSLPEWDALGELVE